MRRVLARIGAAAAVLAIGSVCLKSMDAAPAATDDEMKALLAQDAKAVAKAAEAGTANAKNKNAPRAIKSSAVVVATYANSRITGKDPKADAQAAGIRDEAIKMYAAADAKDFKGAAKIAEGLPTAKPAAKGEKIDLVKAFPGLDVHAVMDNFHTTRTFGVNTEADIKAFGSKKGKVAPTPADAALIAHRVLAMGELCKVVVKPVAAAEVATWKKTNDDMIKAAEELLAAAAKKANAADLAKAYMKLDATCTACHDEFK